VEQHRPSPAALLLLAATATLLLLGSQLPLHAAEDAFFSFSPTPGEPWNLKADRLVIHQEEKAIQAFDNVVLKQEAKRLQADSARYNWETKRIHLQGNVRLNMDKNSATAREAFFDFANETGWLRDGRIFLHDPHIYVSGEELHKTGPRTFRFTSATFTSCDGEKPDWTIRSAQGKVTVDGYATLWHPRFRIKDAPLLYSPFMVLPAKRSRQSGFLFPEVSSSTEDGESVTVSYFQVIDQEQDMTFSVQHMTERGSKLGLEYRLTPDLRTKGLFLADWLEDQKAEEEVEEFDNYQRPGDDRYWLRGKYNGFLGAPAWRSKLDLDLVSDKYYLREFEDGRLGFEDSRQIFLDEFGRDINDKDDPIRENVLTLNRNWPSAALQTRVEYNQNLNYFRDNPDQDPTLQRLPQIDLDIHRNDLLDTPLEWEADSQAVYFWRRKDNTTKGARLDLHPRVSLPLQSAYGTLTPGLGWRETLYYTPETAREDTEPELFERRGIWDFSSRATSKLFRIFHLNPVNALDTSPANRGTSQWSMIKHTLTPQVRYDYVPEQDQSALPSYDAEDRIGARNEVTYSLSNLFTLRRDRIVAEAAQNGTRLKRAKEYRELVDLSLEQSYDIREADRSENLDAYPRRPFSDIRMKAEITPFSWISLTDTTWYSIYEDEITEHEHELDLSHGPLSVFFGYDYMREMDQDIHRKGQEELSIARAGASLKPGTGWQLGYSMERDLKSSELIERKASLGYTHQCWNLLLNYTREPEETTISITIGLRPFGELQQGIPTAE
jgi:LPS-assembly protein